MGPGLGGCCHRMADGGVMHGIQVDMNPLQWRLSLPMRCPSTSGYAQVVKCQIMHVESITQWYDPTRFQISTT